MSEVPEILWHYTTTETLVKIIQSKYLLASNFRYLNDASEMKTGLDNVVHWLGSHENEKISALASNEKFIKGLSGGGWPYVLSFSSDGDNLSMWRGYGNLTQSNNGVAIGFNLEDLNLMASGQIFEDASICFYCKEEFSRKLNIIFNNLDNKAPPFAMFGDLIKMISVGKNPYFEEEKEWRLLIHSFCEKDAPLKEYVNGSYRIRFELDRKVDNIQYPLAIQKNYSRTNRRYSQAKRYYPDSFSKRKLHQNTSH